VTSWSPGDGFADVIRHGGDEPPSRRSHLVAAAAVLVLVGAVLGGGLVAGYRDRLPWPARPAGVPALTAGSVAAASGIGDRHRYRLDQFNPGPGTVRDVQVVAVVGRTATVTPGDPVTIGPRRWRTVTFSLPDECDSPAVLLARSVRVRAATTDAGRREQQVALASPASSIRENHDRECVPTTTLTPADLGGLWVLEEEEGRWAELAGISLMRFTSDGRFAFDPEGRMFEEGHQGFFGTYRLRGDRLLFHGDGGYACARGYAEEWTTTLLADGLLRLDVVRSSEGYCHNPDGERQLLRRLVPAERLPAASVPATGSVS
jgi:hypothetical protein